MKAIIVLLNCLFLTLVREAAALLNEPRVFSEDFLKGLYGRFFEFAKVPFSNPCPTVINHIYRGEPGMSENSWVVSHDKIFHNEALCGDKGMLVLFPYRTTNEAPLALEANQDAQKTFAMLQNESTGFWMGVDSRVCGKWAFPSPSFVFFVREFDRSITTFFNLVLSPPQKYMVIVSSDFTCVYQDIPRWTSTPTASSATPRPVTAAPSVVIVQPTLAETTTSPTASLFMRRTAEGTQTTFAAQPSPSEGVYIEDIQNGAPVPSASVQPSGTTSIHSNQPSAVAEDQEEGPWSSSEADESGIQVIEGTSEESIADIAASYSISGEDGNPDDEENSETLCFPAAGTVEVANGTRVRMDEISVGDEVRTGPSSYSPVYMFTHREPRLKSAFVELQTESHNITLTRGHYVYANYRLIRAGAVKVGDVLHSETGNHTRVTHTSIVQARGLYNPQTIQGDIIVNGIVASTYTIAVQPKIAHGMLAPMRAVWLAIRSNIFISPLQLLSSAENIKHSTEDNLDA